MDPLAMNPRTPRVSADSSSLSERKKAVGQDDHHNSSSSSTFTRAPSPIHLNNPNFSMQQLTLNSAVSPLLSRVAAPFDKSERKRAHTSALYYSECFHRGIQPLDADHAAKGAQEQYDKWWIDRTAKGIQPPKLMSRSTVEQSKRRRIDQEQSNSLTTPNADRKIASSEEQELRVNEIDIQVDAPSPVVKSVGNEEMSTSHHAGDIAAAKRQLITALKESQGDVATPKFLHTMRILEHFYKSKSWDGRGTCDRTPFSLEGNWLTISKPTYDECRGRNENGDLKYNLGRMSFGMFRPTNMVCSVQASFNNVRTIDPKSPDRPLHVPKKLMKEIQSGQILLRTYDIVVAITIEAGQTRYGVRAGSNTVEEYVVPRAIPGILTNQAYVVPDPSVPNRLSIWFSGGDLEVQNEPDDLEEWLKIFDSTAAPHRNLREYATVLAARVLLGALVPEEIGDDGKMSFDLRRPIGGHGQAYCDIIYMDEDLRIMRGHLGSVYVCTRVHGSEHIRTEKDR